MKRDLPPPIDARNARPQAAPMDAANPADSTQTGRAAELERAGKRTAVVFLVTFVLMAVAARKLFHLPWIVCSLPLIAGIPCAWMLAFRPARVLAASARIEKWSSKDRDTTWGQWVP